MTSMSISLSIYFYQQNPPHQSGAAVLVDYITSTILPVTAAQASSIINTILAQLVMATTLLWWCLKIIIFQWTGPIIKIMHLYDYYGR